MELNGCAGWQNGQLGHPDYVIQRTGLCPWHLRRLHAMIPYAGATKSMRQVVHQFDILQTLQVSHYGKPIPILSHLSRHRSPPSTRNTAHLAKSAISRHSRKLSLSPSRRTSAWRPWTSPRRSAVSAHSLICALVLGDAVLNSILQCARCSLSLIQRRRSRSLNISSRAYPSSPIRSPCSE
jgi:hypothetical protein